MAGLGAAGPGWGERGGGPAPPHVAGGPPRAGQRMGGAGGGCRGAPPGWERGGGSGESCGETGHGLGARHPPDREIPPGRTVRNRGEQTTPTPGGTANPKSDEEPPPQGPPERLHPREIGDPPRGTGDPREIGDPPRGTGDPREIGDPPSGNRRPPGDRGSPLRGQETPGRSGIPPREPGGPGGRGGSRPGGAGEDPPEPGGVPGVAAAPHSPPPPPPRNVSAYDTHAASLRHGAAADGPMGGLSGAGSPRDPAHRARRPIGDPARAGARDVGAWPGVRHAGHAPGAGHAPISAAVNQRGHAPF
ncbi:collagen alpha-1(I) chain-like [Poecile atricapillus]|uniref:collagen alpha-1(I) chain-like n=1 Tax=Poecile atricapillus TaxID=48891 RepID=UPI0027386F6D|nr:collagen alpha-1(I) chain-like [Poecile atricapillus]